MTEDVDTECVVDGLVASPELIGEVGTEEGHEVLPELIECGDTKCSALAHTQNSRLLGISTGGRSLWKRLLDEIGD